MAISAIKTILDYELPPREKLIMLAYAYYADENGDGVWPSVATLCKKTGYKQGTIRRVYPILEKAGLLTRVGTSKHQTIIWKVNLNWKGTRDDVELCVNAERAQRGARLTLSTLDSLTGSAVARLTGSNDPLSESLDDTEEITPYQRLLTAFTNASKLPVMGQISKRDNEALVAMVEAGCTPDDIAAAVAYSTQNDLTIVGPASIKKGAILEAGKRKRQASMSGPRKLGNRPFPKGA